MTAVVDQISKLSFLFNQVPIPPMRREAPKTGRLLPAASPPPLFPTAGVSEVDGDALQIDDTAGASAGENVSAAAGVRVSSETDDPMVIEDSSAFAVAADGDTAPVGEQNRIERADE